jgi:hypothetical protein
MNVVSPMNILANSYASVSIHGMMHCKLLHHSLCDYYSMVGFWIEYVLVSVTVMVITV